MDTRDNRTCLWTFERLHEKTMPLLIRGEHEVSTLFEMRGESVEISAHYTDWYKSPLYPSVVWLN